jgi:predicted nucleotidyltransferase
MEQQDIETPALKSWLQEMVQRIVDRFNPERVILFGSTAYGKLIEDSDVDLLVIMESDKRPIQRIAEVSEVIRPRLVAVDLLVKTPAEVQKRLEIGDSFVAEILKKGKVLYERPAGRRVGD